MPRDVVLITGFGPFPGVADNPSIQVARHLEQEPPTGVRVIARELPVTFEGAPEAVAAAAREAGDALGVLLGLGVQPEPTFRLERRARGRLDGARPDNSGRTASGVGVDLGGDLETALDLEHLAAVLTEAGAPRVAISEDAGGYVCERTYHALLARAGERGVPALFLHVPPIEVMAPADQAPIVRALVAELARQSLSSSSGRSSAD